MICSKQIIFFKLVFFSFRNMILFKEDDLFAEKYEIVYRRCHLLVRSYVVLASNWCGGPKYPGASASICQEAWGTLRPNILIDPHRDSQHVKCVRGGARGSRAFCFSCLQDVCLCDDLQEGTLTWSLLRNSLTHGTLGEFFSSFMFAPFLVIDCCIVCSCIFVRC